LRLILYLRSLVSLLSFWILSLISSNSESIEIANIWTGLVDIPHLICDFFWENAGLFTILKRTVKFKIDGVTQKCSIQPRGVSCENLGN
jgi:hypothetical protein